MSLKTSKAYFFRRLARDLAAHRTGVGLDAGAAYFKNFHFFRTPVYIGADIERAALEKGLALHPQGKALLIDLARVKLPENTVDVCVCTHTLDALDDAARQAMTANLVAALKPGGFLFCNMRKGGAALETGDYLRANFAQVREMHYCNPVSAWIELALWERGHKGFAVKLAMRILMALESITVFFPALTTDIYFRCRGRKTNGPPQDFDFSIYQKLAPHLWAADAEKGRL